MGTTSLTNKLDKVSVVIALEIVFLKHLDLWTNSYSLRPTLFVLFEKSNFLREHHLLSCLPFKNV